MASKSKSRRRVFRASCILAALIVAGSSFAWFSSKDEVTNRLSASANYGVSIVEDFQPPKNFLPGQKVNKDVAVVNTGNVDAFVRTWIDGEMSLVAKTDYNGDGAVQADATGATRTDVKSVLTKTADDQTKLTSINLNWYDNNGTYYKELSQIKSENPLNSTTSTEAANEGTNIPARFSEVQSIQAGGVLVYHAPGAEYYYVLEQATTVTGKKVTGGTAAGEETTEMYPAGTIVSTDNSVKKGDAGVIIADDYYGNIDTSEFFPDSEGLYLFRRNVKETGASNAVDDYEYTGYYYCNDATNTTTASPKDGDKSTNDAREGNPVYLALCYDNTHAQRSDYVLPDAAVETRTGEPAKDEVLPVTLKDVELYTAKEKVLTSYATAGNVTYTVDGVTKDVTALDSAVTISATTYTHSVTVGTDTYVGTSDEGEFVKYNSDTNTVDTNAKKTVIKTTSSADDGFTWTYVPHTDAVAATYKLGAASATPEYDDTNVGNGSEYVWKTIVSGNTYWSKTKTGDYYAESQFSSVPDGTLADGAISVTMTEETPAVAEQGPALVATYGTGDKQIKINVQLANLDNNPTASTAETWSVIQNVTGDNKKWTFYYNNDVEEGASTTKLIDYVELDESVEDEAFLAFDFDLNVFMESVQVVLDEQGNETCDPIVNPWANPSTTENNTNANYNAATGTKNGTSAEIESITWAAVTP